MDSYLAPTRTPSHKEVLHFVLSVPLIILLNIFPITVGSWIISSHPQAGVKGNLPPSFGH
jgi:hypothetical protein